MMAKTSLHNICLNFPSENINPCKNFVEAGIWRSASFKGALMQI